jgi:cyclophilin family peptidyl-prolyl cis-trans isomerase
MRTLAVTCALLLVSLALLQGQRATARGGSADPLLTIGFAKGAVEVRLFQADAPKTIEHILALVKRNFYRGQRIHRVERSLVQFGDPNSRDVSRKDWWGRAGSGRAVGVAEFNRHRHVRGAVAMAHTGDARYADSQIYIVRAPMPSLDGKHVVIGQVTRGMDVIDKLVVGDVLKTVTLTAAGQK